MTDKSGGIVCRQRFRSVNRLIFACFGILLALASVIALVKPAVLDLGVQNQPVYWIVYGVGLLLYLVSSPDLTIFEDGIEVSMLQKNFFVHWDQVIEVKRYKYYSVFKVEKLTPLNRMAGLLITHTFKPSFSVAANSSNYAAAMEVISHKLGERFVYIR